MKVVITIQNMAPFPWHFGGQRYQNIFADPSEIVEFASEMIVITLDTSFYVLQIQKLDFSAAIIKLLPYTAHIHMSDASGLNGEGGDKYWRC